MGNKPINTHIHGKGFVGTKRHQKNMCYNDIVHPLRAQSIDKHSCFNFFTTTTMAYVINQNRHYDLF